MPQVESPDQKRTYLPSLEGIRGYAFLLVFFYHYLPASLFPYRTNPWLYPVSLVLGVSWLAVPMFFALSGYLIGGILYDTRDREGYFKVFYSRRILRIFPVYYLTLLIVALFDSLHGVSLDLSYWAQFLYIQNLVPGYARFPHAAPANQIVHLWSLAVEEQFYLLWPLVVWLCRDRRTLLKVTAVLIVACSIIRFLAPWLHISSSRSYFATPTRVDAILLGVMLALIRRDLIYKRLEPFAKYVALAGTAGMMGMIIITGSAAPSTPNRIAVLFPLVNLTAAALVVAVMEENSFLCRVCSLRWITWLGSLSYGLYVFHLTYGKWFIDSVLPRVAALMPAPCALVVTALIAFALTLLLAVVSYRFIELPAINLKKRFKYGPVRKAPAPQESLEQSFAPSGID
jgi:peptidoglycan/LPS O-acetylase OafA/YrhL